MHESILLESMDSIALCHLMMLGVVIHSTLAIFLRRTLWAFQDPEVGSEFSMSWDPSISFECRPSFCSPVFSALLWMRRTPREMLINRFQRIVLPFLVFLIPLTYLTDFSAEYSERLLDGDPTPFYTACGIPIKWMPESTMHLWFLYDLVIITALHTVVVALIGRFNVSVERTHRFVRDMVDRPWFFLVFMGLGPTSSLGSFRATRAFRHRTPGFHIPLILYYWFGTS